MGTDRTIIRYLTQAKLFIQQATGMIECDEQMQARVYLQQARRMLARADRLIVRKHVTECLPGIIKYAPPDRVISEVLKIYAYANA